MFTNNQIVKEWTVIKRAEDRYIGRNQKRVFFWLCKCNKCGKLQEVEQQRLKNPIKYNCCKICSLKLIKTKDYTGQKYNFVTILKVYKDNVWVCQCDCGNIFNWKGWEIASGGKRSCGECNNRNKNVENYPKEIKFTKNIGLKFGRFTIVKENKYPYFECVCECGNKKEVLIYDLVSGKSKSCGCFHKERSSETMKKTIRTFSFKKFCYKNLNQYSRLYLIPASLKKIIKYRDNLNCVLCMSKNNLVIHHIIPYQENVKLLTEITNLITLCKKCHKEVHDFNFHGPVNQQLQSTLEKIAEINTELLDINLKVKYEENKKQASNKFKIPTRQNCSV